MEYFQTSKETFEDRNDLEKAYNAFGVKLQEFIMQKNNEMNCCIDTVKQRVSEDSARFEVSAREQISRLKSEITSRRNIFMQEQETYRKNTENEWSSLSINHRAQQAIAKALQAQANHRVASMKTKMRYFYRWPPRVPYSVQKMLDDKTEALAKAYTDALGLQNKLISQAATVLNEMKETIRIRTIEFDNKVKQKRQEMETNINEKRDVIKTKGVQFLSSEIEKMKEKLSREIFDYKASMLTEIDTAQKLKLLEKDKQDDAKVAEKTIQMNEILNGIRSSMADLQKKMTFEKTNIEKHRAEVMKIIDDFKKDYDMQILSMNSEYDEKIAKIIEEKPLKISKIETEFEKKIGLTREEIEAIKSEIASKKEMKKLEVSNIKSDAKNQIANEKSKVQNEMNRIKIDISKQIEEQKKKTNEILQDIMSDTEKTVKTMINSKKKVEEDIKKIEKEKEIEEATKNTCSIM